MSSTPETTASGSASPRPAGAAIGQALKQAPHLVQASSMSSTRLGESFFESGVLHGIRIAQNRPARERAGEAGCDAAAIQFADGIFTSSNSKLVCKSSTCARDSHIAIQPSPGCWVANWIADFCGVAFTLQSRLSL